MNVDTFLAHHQLAQNPFAAEEARLDPVFDRLTETKLTHPDYPKIAGTPGRPSTSVVFGEKGTGKTAIRILMGKGIVQHNQDNPEAKTLLVPYDELNPVLDNLMRAKKQDAKKLFETIRLADHQDAILSSAVTSLTDSILGGGQPGEQAVTLPDNLTKTLRKLPKQSRADLAVLAALYDQPRTGDPSTRHNLLIKQLKSGFTIPLALIRHTAAVFSIAFAALYITSTIWAEHPSWVFWGWIGSAAAALGAWGYWGFRHVSLWLLARRIQRETPAVNRTVGQLKAMLANIPGRELSRQPWPVPHQDERPDTDSRYQLTRRLLDAISHLGYTGMTVLVDRVDEPTLIAGDSDKMKQIVWPMFDAKFLQQDRTGIKLLLPVELRYELRKESPTFFREARLDKGNLVERLTWTGSTLYDLCSFRLKTCRPPENGDVTLMSLFAEDVDRAMLIDSLDQMHQPRDAFKFLYAVIQEHCQSVPEDDNSFTIARSTLDTIRKTQASRVQDLYRGLTPA